MLSNKEYHALDLVPYPYTDMDWRAFPNIFSTEDEPLDERGNINIMFKLIQFHFITLFNKNEKYYNIFFKLLIIKQFEEIV